MEYFTLITSIGASKIALATANNTTLALTHIAVGDGAGNIAMPDASRTALVNETYRASLTDLTVDENNTNWVVAVGYIPSNEGNFWVREVGIFDVDGDLIAIGNYPETFKPVTADGVAKDLYMKVIFEVSSLESITLQVDPSLVMASREHVDKGLKDKSDKTHKHNWSEIEQKPTTFPPSSHNHDTVYAKLGGLATQKFKVEDAVADDEAVNKGQLKNAISGINCGKILQIIQIKTNTSLVTTAINTDVSLNLEANIIPKTVNSKILVMLTFSIGLSNLNGGFFLKRGNSKIGGTGTSSSFSHPDNFYSADETSVTRDYAMDNINFNYIDSPNSDTNLTYSLGFRSGVNSGTAECYFNRARNSALNATSNATITLMEIGE
uniref:phage tail protein n=1 Tax=Aliarcobacter sp. TaxID=2321116 RepID=UPI0040478F78